MSAVVVVEAGVWAVGDVELQAVTLYIVQYNGTGTLPEVGKAQGEGSKRWEAWREGGKTGH